MDLRKELDLLIDFADIVWQQKQNAFIRCVNCDLNVSHDSLKIHVFHLPLALKGYKNESAKPEKAWNCRMHTYDLCLFFLVSS